MIEDARFTLRWWLLQFKRDRLVSTYERALKKIRRINQSAGEKREEIRGEAALEIGDVDGEIAELNTRHLIYLTQKYLLPPPSDDDWAPDEDAMPYRYLKPEGANRLRAAIRVERRERHDWLLRWTPAITGIGGLVVAIIALLTTHH